MTNHFNRYISLAFIITMSSLYIVKAQDNMDWMSEYNFAYLDTTLSKAQFDARYAGTNNFIGSPIKGYLSTRLVMARPAAEGLRKAESVLNDLGYGLKIFDSYRPQRAVNHFIAWAKDAADTVNRHSYYPEHDKANLFDLGYISSRSGHTRGSTIDLTIYHLDSGEEVDMGAPYDYFGTISHHGFEDITLQQKKNRELLKSILSQCGFRAYSKEWWHYTLRDEPYPDRYFDFVVKE